MLFGITRSSGSGRPAPAEAVRIALAVAVAAAVAAALLCWPLTGARAAPRPSFVVIQTDDQPVEEFHGRWTDLWGRSRPIMPQTMRLVRDQGIEFNQYLTPFPLCAPSRASLWSGQYAQHHGVIRIGGPRGGWNAYRSNPIMNENLAVWLQRAGYRTSHFGKFENNYGGPDGPAESDVPPGWDRWVSDATDNSTREFYGYRQNVDGQITPRLGYPFYDALGGGDPEGCPWLGLQACNYHTDSMSIQAEQEIRGNPGRPLYLQIDYHTPHGDSRPPIGPEPAPRHYDTAIQTPGPTPPGYNEVDVSDKPWFLRYDTPPLTSGEVQSLGNEYRKSIEALRSVDDGVARVIKALRETGRLRNTYVIFTSDNGFFLGQHRINRGKLLPYEPALRVPFVMRGPGIRPGTTSRELVANQDIAPTLLRLAGARASGYALDGRPMNRFWQRPRLISRRPILLSSYQGATRLIEGDYPDDQLIVFGRGRIAPRRAAQASVKSPNQNYEGIRVGPYQYVRYEAEGEGELYVLTRDPYQLNNHFGEPGYGRIQGYLATQLDRLRTCAGAACNTPVPPWPKPPGGAAGPSRKR